MPRIRIKRPILRNALGLSTQPLRSGLPGGVDVPTVAWLESNCSIQDFDYGNGNTERQYTCVHFGSGNRKWRCRWRRWNMGAIQWLECTEITAGHYHEVHGGSEGPQAYGTPQSPPYVPYGCWPPQVPETRPECIPTWLRAETQASLQPYGRWTVRNPETPPWTPVCPEGQEVCGDPVPGQSPPCCPIIKTPTPTQRVRRRLRRILDRIAGRA